MIQSFRYLGMRYSYEQPKLPWYWRLVGRKYGPKWKIRIDDSKSITESESSPVGPSPALVMETLLKTMDKRRGMEE